MEAMDKLDVFEAIMQSSLTKVSNSENTFFFISRFSMIASIIKSELLNSFKELT